MKNTQRADQPPAIRKNVRSLQERRGWAIAPPEAGAASSAAVPPNAAAVQPEARAWARWVEPWYLACGLLGATVAGLLPILLPLAVARRHGAAEVGLVMAALSLGGLTAPLWGGLADRYRLHRWLLAGGLFATAAGVAAFSLTTGSSVALGLTLLQGVGAAAAATVANLFVVEGPPPGGMG